MSNPLDAMAALVPDMMKAMGAEYFWRCDNLLLEGPCGHKDFDGCCWVLVTPTPYNPKEL